LRDWPEQPKTDRGGGDQTCVGRHWGNIKRAGKLIAPKVDAGGRGAGKKGKFSKAKRTGKMRDMT